ncbi:VOC family protein [Paenibacillus mendelii]|uniref:VOC family protein n=1 Tax=Paenibacillus mendelii TaxID=206163 RepID=A0ABV6JF39_9BACL|nr:VOC family protein [Paenibacillus mendelii]MCQ6557410.1 VOC family protein [Paenibacillus mendelii]
MSEGIINRVSHVMVPVRELDESITWYEANLGFRLHWKRNDGKMAILTLPEGPHFFLWETEHDTYAHFNLRDGIQPVIGIEAADIRKLLHTLRYNGVQLGEVRVERGEGMDFEFFDPSGNMLVAHEPYQG